MPDCPLKSGQFRIGRRPIFGLFVFLAAASFGGQTNGQQRPTTAPASLVRQQIDDLFKVLDARMECDQFTLEDNTIRMSNVRLFSDSGADQIAARNGDPPLAWCAIPRVTLLLPALPRQDQPLQISNVDLEQPRIPLDPKYRSSTQPLASHPDRSMMATAALFVFGRVLSEPNSIQLKGKISAPADLRVIKIRDLVIELPPNGDKPEPQKFQFSSNVHRANDQEWEGSVTSVLRSTAAPTTQPITLNIAIRPAAEGTEIVTWEINTAKTTTVPFINK